VENGVREEPGGGGGFACSGPGRGRGKGGQTRKWAPGSAVEPTGHPFKHALRGRGEEIGGAGCGGVRRPGGGGAGARGIEHKVWLVVAPVERQEIKLVPYLPEIKRNSIVII
jgi:hypothetical protein